MAKEYEALDNSSSSSNNKVKQNISEELEKAVLQDNPEHLQLSRQEVIRRLRDRTEPILLFGESELDAFKRLRKCEILEPESNKVSSLYQNILQLLLIMFIMILFHLGFP